MGCKPWTDPTLKRNLVKKPQIPPQRKFRVGEQDDRQVLIDFEGSYPKGNLGRENKMKERNIKGYLDQKSLTLILVLKILTSK